MSIYIIHGILTQTFITIRHVVKDWAKEEAIVRNQIIANGGTIQFGKWYNVNEFEQDDDDPEAASKPPVMKEKGG